MTKMKWMNWMRWSSMALVSGGSLFASACTSQDFRNAVLAGVLDFIEGTTEGLLEGVVPVAELLGG
jgi:hypothetical protein